MADVDVIKRQLPKTATGAASARRWSAVGATCHGQRRRAIPPGGGRRNCRKLTAAPAYCVIPFLLPPPKNPCPTRAKKASQAGRRRFDPGRPLFRYPSERSPLYREEAPLLGHAVEGVRAAVGEAQARTGDEVLHGARDEHARGPGQGRGQVGGGAGRR